MQLTVLQHNITAEQAFGASSTLVEQTIEGSAVSSVLFGAPFQVAAVAIGLIYTIFVLRYWDFLCYFLINAVGIKQPRRDQAHINPAEERNIEVVMILLGVLICSLVVVKVCGAWFPHLLSGIEPAALFWAISVVVVVALTAMLLLQYGFTKLIALVCDRVDIGAGIVNTKLLYLAVGFVTVMPFGLLFLLCPQPFSIVGFWGAVFCMTIAVIIFVKESFLFFVSQKISILHWILYLCALEIFPVSLILAPILR